ncbi:TonB-dependent receptor plug domain-containing protein [Sphingomicrobium lutaoense]|uniref:Outer membrane receptor protein involved in Fe transport n=1 Tax=Sphingomicrobium lutaoense TaxID=515949 RepID=A0A839Z3C0_9SPHN|nr:TonB-dependent receptor [Sphingomicrobium lutaoense]MBB3764577.1 outer membrane receptor protein involved in Fe transport [Sphingomicrobium lutaoense]
MKKFHKSSLLTSTVIAGMAFASPAFAQDADDDTGPVEQVSTDVDAQGEVLQGSDPIVITGTRIARPNVESASPVTVVGEEAIAQVGTTRVEDLVNSLPQVTPGQTAFVANGATGTATVDLRGLGTARTLVLVNGRRLQPGDPFLPAADLNQIPASLVSRVEVLTGGASSTYGADAVAGVVNFIMDTDFEGVQLDATYGVYQHDNRNDESFNGRSIREALDARGYEYPRGNVVDGDTFDAQLTIGAGFDDGRGNVVGYVGYRRIGSILQGNRDYSACAINTAGRCGGSFNSPNATVVDPTFGGFFFGVADGSDDFSGFGKPGGPPYNYAPVNFFQRPDVRWTAGAFANYEISDAAEAYAEFMFMDDRSDAQIAESGTFFGEVYNLSCDSPLLTAAQGDALCAAIDGQAGAGDTAVDRVVPILIGKRNVEGGGRNADLRHTGYRAVAGVRGDITERFSYDMSAQYGTTIYSNFYTNDFSFSRLRDAIQAVEVNGQVVCADPIARANGCVPYNPFQGQGLVNDPRNGVTQGALNYVLTPGLQKGETEEWVATGYITGDLFNIVADEPVSAVVGAEYRQEILALDSDVAFASGDLAGQGGPSPSVSGEFDVKDVFAEILVPIITDVPGVNRLALEAGYRYSDYSTGATTDTYKLLAEYSPIPEVKFRGGYNRAVRAANILELFSPQALGLWSGTDPCSGPTPEFTAAQCANTGVTAGQYGSIAPSPADQYNQIGGGNPNVNPEKADTITAGVVIEGGSILPGFVATVDYFDIEVEDAISGIGAETILRQCALTGDALFCSLVQRDPISGSLWAGQNGFIVNTQQNIGGITTEGIDVGVSYNRGLGAGRLNLDLQGSYLMEYAANSGIPVAGGDAIVDCAGYVGSFCGFPQPEWRHTFRAAYNFDSGVGLSFRWRHIGSVELDQFINDPDRAFSGTPDANGNIDAHNYFDASVNFDVTDEFGFRVGVNNILDKSPPLVPSAYGTDNANTWAGTYDPVGRFLFVSGTLRF